MTPRIELLSDKVLVGICLEMNLLNNRTGLLWSQFSPRIKEVTNRITEDKISLQVYPRDYFSQFSPASNFEKWALVEVNDLESIPEGMSPFKMEGGSYAVFDYKGSSSDASVFQYIFTQWLPNSDFMLDDRPHFEVLGEKYVNNDPNSEEEIWIPIIPINQHDKK